MSAVELPLNGGAITVPLEEGVVIVEVADLAVTVETTGPPGPAGPPGDLTQAVADNLYVSLIGDLMTGALTTPRLFLLHNQEMKVIFDNFPGGMPGSYIWGRTDAEGGMALIISPGGTISETAGVVQFNGTSVLAPQINVTGAVNADRMTVVTVVDDPEAVTNKGYVDSAIAAGGGGGGLDQATADSLYVNIDGDDMTGDLTTVNLNADRVQLGVFGPGAGQGTVQIVNHTIKSSAVDPDLVITPSVGNKARIKGTLSLENTNRIIEVADPQNAQDVATKAYADTKSGFIVSASEPTTKIPGLIWVTP